MLEQVVSYAACIALAMQSDSDIEYRFYDKYFFSQDLEPYPVQEQAFAHIFRGESVLVTVPTGTGKTLMAKAALFKALERRQTAVYTTPLRALTEEKFRELSHELGAEHVGFATGDYKVNPQAPIQVIVAEILWNRIYGDHVLKPAEVVVMDEGHYFNDPERGYVWEQSIIGLDPRTQLVILSATVGNPAEFCQWVYTTRQIPMALVESTERRVPLYHQYRESYLIEVVRDLYEAGDHPAIVFVFGREQCLERARLIKSCRRFTSDAERERITELAGPVLLDRGAGPNLRSLLLHGIGVHHAGILPRYKRLVEQLTLERLIKFVVSTETISAGINLPAKRVLFPELRKHIKGEARLLTSAEYHQMSGRAGRPQFDHEGIAIALAPDEVVQALRKEIKAAGAGADEVRLRKTVYARARAEAKKNDEVIWDEEAHQRLVQGKPAALRSQTKITAEQILAIGLADEQAGAPADQSLPAALRLDIRTVIDHLLLDERSRHEARRHLEQLIDNLKALGVLDEHGRHVAGQLILKLRGIDGPFVYYCLQHHDLSYEELRELVEYLVEHDIIHKLVTRKQDEKKREWILNRLREQRREGMQVSWEDVEQEYERLFPRPLAPVEQLHQSFTTLLPHPELHGGKVHKTIWTAMESEELSFLDYTERYGLDNEEGNLFTYLARVMKTARMLHEATGLDELKQLERRVRACLAMIDERVLEEV
jgi:superfamily II DNA/RNA helicase